MARLMRYMINYQGRKLFSTLSIRLSKSVLYSLPPPVMEPVFQDGVSWECRIGIVNKDAFPDGTVFYYTLDGSDPTRESAVLAEDTVIGRNLTVRMLAVCEEEHAVLMSADIGTLVIDALRNGIPVFTIRAEVGELPVPQLIRTDGDKAYECVISVGNEDSYYQGTKFVYTINGSEPDADSARLPATVDRNCTVKARAIFKDNLSPVAVINISNLRNGIPIFTIETF